MPPRFGVKIAFFIPPPVDFSENRDLLSF